MAKLDYNRPRGGYEQEPWRKTGSSKSNKKIKKLWQDAIYNETKFLSGKYWNQDIAGIIELYPEYCIWILENQPHGVIAKQIIRHFNRHQTNQKGIKTRSARMV